MHTVIAVSWHIILCTFTVQFLFVMEGFWAEEVLLELVCVGTTPATFAEPAALYTSQQELAIYTAEAAVLT